MATTTPSQKQEIVIIGGGIIGATSAYYLTRHPAYSPLTHSITLLEASTIASGSSGKAGGLLALWAYPSNIVPLSFRLHEALAAEHNGAERWGYRRLGCGSVECVASALPPSLAQAARRGDSVGLNKLDDAATRRLGKMGFPADLDWVDAGAARGYEAMGTSKDTGQVHPLHFTTAVMALAQEAGVRVLEGARVRRIEEEGGAVRGVAYEKDGAAHTVAADRVVLAAGPWTQRLWRRAPIEGLRAHSVVIKADVSPYALFTSISGGSRRHAAPEIYARPFGEIYACGEGDETVPLPELSTDVEVDQGRCDDIIEQVGSVSRVLRDGEVKTRQACYLPVVKGSGGPFIGETRQVKGLILASGHSCWGIQNGPGTGKLVSEIVMEGKAASAKLGSLDPARAL